jgi:hypothetical protein
MDHENRNRLSDDLDDVAERLRASRVTATPLELDELKLRARRQASRKSFPGGRMLKSRLGLTAVIVTGLLMSGTGAGLAASGSSGSDNAAENQYRTPTTESQQPAAQQVESNTPQSGGEDSQPVQQVAAANESDGSLPFTGFLAIPLLIGGIALVVTGGVLRRKSREE